MSKVFEEFDIECPKYLGLALNGDSRKIIFSNESQSYIPFNKKFDYHVYHMNGVHIISYKSKNTTFFELIYDDKKLRKIFISTYKEPLYLKTNFLSKQQLKTIRSYLNKQ